MSMVGCIYLFTLVQQKCGLLNFAQLASVGGGLWTWREEAAEVSAHAFLAAIRQAVEFELASRTLSSCPRKR